MGIGPAPAIKQLLKVTDKNLNDVELVEVKILIKISFKCRCINQTRNYLYVLLD